MDNIPLSPAFWNGVGVVGVVVFVFLLLVFDRGITLKSRVTDRDKIIASKDVTIERLQDSGDTKDQIIANLTGAVQVSAQGFQKVGQYAEQVAGGEGE